MSVCGWLIDATGRQYPLDNSQSFRVGRDSASSLVLSHSSVSRVHAEISFKAVPLASETSGAPTEHS